MQKLIGFGESVGVYNICVLGIDNGARGGRKLLVCFCQQKMCVKKYENTYTGEELENKTWGRGKVQALI